MVEMDLAALVESALLEMGCDSSLLGKIDSHSTIALDFNGRPSIYVSEKEGDIWLWSKIYEYHDEAFDQLAPKLLKELMQGYEFIRGEHPALVTNEGYFELKALVHTHCLVDGKNFAQALNGFFECVGNFLETIVH